MLSADDGFVAAFLVAVLVVAAALVTGFLTLGEAVLPLGLRRDVLEVEERAALLPSGAVDGRSAVCLVLVLEGLELSFPSGLAPIPEAAGILLGAEREAGAVLEREAALDEERPDLGLMGRRPLVDLLSLSETGAERRRRRRRRKEAVKGRWGWILHDLTL